MAKAPAGRAHKEADLKRAVGKVGTALERMVKEVITIEGLTSAEIDKVFQYLHSLVTDAHTRTAFSYKLTGFSLNMELPAAPPAPSSPFGSFTPASSPEGQKALKRMAGQNKKPAQPPSPAEDDVGFIDD
jgi:hypothetical protein